MEKKNLFISCWAEIQQDQGSDWEKIKIQLGRWGLESRL